MSTQQTIPLDEQFFRWLIVQISRMKRGSIDLQIEDGKLRSIGCHGHRYMYSLDELQEPVA